MQGEYELDKLHARADYVSIYSITQGNILCGTMNVPSKRIMVPCKVLKHAVRLKYTVVGVMDNQYICGLCNTGTNGCRV